MNKINIVNVISIEDCGKVVGDVAPLVRFINIVKCRL